MNAPDLPSALRGESRRHVRVQESTRLLWHIRESGLVGQGRIRNISASGMLVELTSVNGLPDQSIFSFDSNLNDANYIPEAGRLVWRRKKRFSNDKYLCGFEFNGLPEVLASRLNKRVADGVKQLVSAWKINRIVSISLAITTVVLIGYAVWLGGIIFQDIYGTNQKLLVTASRQGDLIRQYQSLYADATRRLADVTLELNQTATLYQEAQNQLQSTKSELTMVKSVLSETENLLAQAQTITAPQAAQIAVTPNAVRSVQEGKAFIASYRDRIKEVAAQIDQIKYENHLARISALAERDRIRLMYGNQGYMAKNGQPVRVDERQYKAASFNALPPGKNPNLDPKIRVNVTVFQ